MTETTTTEQLGTIEETKKETADRLINNMTAMWKELLTNWSGSALENAIQSGSGADYALSLQPCAVGAVFDDESKWEDFEKRDNRAHIPRDPNKMKYTFGVNSLTKEQIYALVGGEDNFQLKAQAAKQQADAEYYRPNSNSIRREPQVDISLPGGITYEVRVGNYGQGIGFKPEYSYASLPYKDACVVIDKAFNEHRASTAEKPDSSPVPTPVNEYKDIGSEI